MVFGPVFPPLSKAREVASAEDWKSWNSRRGRREIPVLALGGITPENRAKRGGARARRE